MRSTSLEAINLDDHLLGTLYGIHALGSVVVFKYCPQIEVWQIDISSTERQSLCPLSLNVGGLRIALIN